MIHSLTVFPSFSKANIHSYISKALGTFSLFAIRSLGNMMTFTQRPPSSRGLYSESRPYQPHILIHERQNKCECQKCHIPHAGQQHVSSLLNWRKCSRTPWIPTAYTTQLFSPLGARRPSFPTFLSLSLARDTHNKGNSRFRFSHSLYENELSPLSCHHLNGNITDLV